MPNTTQDMQNPQAQTVRPMNMEAKPSKNNTSIMIVSLVAALLGIGTGYFIFAQNLFGTTAKVTTTTSSNGSTVSKGAIVGSNDATTFKDQAEGTLQKGGIDGEGSHKLIRPGGDSQTVYLSSATIDLDQYVGKKVRVWGQTNSAQKAGWLMDVGRLEVLE
jgi:hypothetical protein